MKVRLASAESVRKSGRIDFGSHGDFSVPLTHFRFTQIAAKLKTSPKQKSRERELIARGPPSPETSNASAAVRKLAIPLQKGFATLSPKQTSTVYEYTPLVTTGGDGEVSPLSLARVR